VGSRTPKASKIIAHAVPSRGSHGGVGSPGKARPMAIRPVRAAEKLRADARCPERLVYRPFQGGTPSNCVTRGFRLCHGYVATSTPWAIVLDAFGVRQELAIFTRSPGALKQQLPTRPTDVCRTQIAVKRSTNDEEEPSAFQDRGRFKGALPSKSRLCAHPRAERVVVLTPRKLSSKRKSPASHW
jgi:hypothetical protein